MDLRLWLQRWLGIHDLHQKVVELDSRIGEIEGLVEAMLQNFGRYRSRTTEELALIQGQLETLLVSMNNVVDSVQNNSDRQRASRLRARLKNNLTRVENARRAS